MDFDMTLDQNYRAKKTALKIYTKWLAVAFDNLRNGTAAEWI